MTRFVYPRARRRLLSLLGVGLACSISFASCSGIFAQPMAAHGSDGNEIISIQGALREGNLDLAQTLAKKALRESPRDPRLWALEGMVFSAQRKDSEALGAFKHALRFAPEFPAALEGAAQILYSRRDPAGIPLLHQLEKMAPENPTTHAMLGSLEYEQKNYRSAAAEFAEGTAAIGNAPDALFEYGASLAELSRFEESAQLFTRAQMLRPDDPVLRYNLALAQWRAGNGDNAIGTLEPLLDKEDSPSEVHSLAAQIFEAQGKVPEAVAELRRGIKLNPQNPENYLDFAALSYRYRSYEAGIDMLNAGLTQLSQSSQLYAARGVLYAQIAQFDDAFADFEHANALDPAHAFGTLATGVADSQQQNAKAAIASFRLQIKQHPQEALGHFLLAEALSEHGGGNDSQGMAEAINAAKTAARLDSTMLGPHDLLATMYLQREDTAEAIGECHRALAIQPNDEQALYHLVLALRRTGSKEEIAALVGRLAAAHQAATTESGGHKNYQLTVVKPQ